MMMNSLSFVAWLRENVRPDRKLTNIFRDGQTITLKEERESFYMEVKIDGVDRHLIVINFEQQGSGSTYLKGDMGFGDRCDFLILDETPKEYVAYLIELKRKVPDKSGAEQLRWSVPFLKYIFSVFREDNYPKSDSKKLRLKYFQIGKDYQSWVKRQKMRRYKQGRFLKWNGYERFNILYCASDGIKFKEFKV